MRPMTKLMKLTTCALVAAAVATPALAASADYFLKLGDVKGESAKGSDRHKDQIEVLSWSWGETQRADALTDGLMVLRTTAPPPTAPGGVRVAAGDVNGDGRADKFGAVGGMHRDDGVSSQRDAASGMPTGKRQHGWIKVSQPLDRGAVRVKVKFPWLDCRVGAAFEDAVLHNDAGRFEFKDAIITSCAADSLSLNYAKVTVRAWDPARKE